jgi:hypothetical protein
MKKSVIIDSLDKLDIAMRVARSMFDERGPQEVIIHDYEQTRAAAQNRLAFLWYGAAAVQLQDESVEGYRAYCKLHFGVPIRREDEDFLAVYDKWIRPLPYEAKLELMVGVIDFPVTRNMTTKQMCRYLEAMEVHFSGLAVDLPKPDDIYNKAMGRK